MTADNSPIVFPIYVAVDVSASMAGVIQELNRALAAFLTGVTAQPGVTDMVQLSIVSFSDDARIELPLTDLKDEFTLPSLVIRGKTRYSDVFNLLRQLIERDVAGLKANGVRILRPAVFFLSDGAPTDTDCNHGERRTWSTALEALTSDSFPYRPNIVAFGIGAADPGVIQKVASRPEFAFLSALETDLSEAVLGFVATLELSVVNSGKAALAGEARLMVIRPEDFVQIPDSL